MATIDYNDGIQLAEITSLLEANKIEIIGNVLKEIIKDPLYQDESGTYIWLETFKDWGKNYFSFDFENNYFLLEDGDDNNIIIRESMSAELIQRTPHIIHKVEEYFFFIHIN